MAEYSHAEIFGLGKKPHYERIMVNVPTQMLLNENSNINRIKLIESINAKSKIVDLGTPDRYRRHPS